MAAAFEHLYWLPFSAAHYQMLIDQGIPMVSQYLRWHPPVRVEAFRDVSVALNRVEDAVEFKQAYLNHDSFLTTAFVATGFLAHDGQPRELLEAGRVIHDFDHGVVGNRVTVSPLLGGGLRA